MGFWYKTRGAVSIFLVIVLVPMMTVAGLFVDASKVKLAKGVAKSAGDLTLNTALTNYDTVLKDMYGLFATAQDMDEINAKLEDYYKTCIISAGVSDADAQTYAEQIMAQLNLVASDDNTADMLNMELIDFSVTKHDQASLANATIIEKQIVEFMKYRGPINTGMSFLSSLNSFTTLSKQTDLIDKRQTYYQTQQKVMETLKGAWGFIAKYNALDIRNDGYLESVKEKFDATRADGWREKYRNQINQKTIKDLYETQVPSIYLCMIQQEDIVVKNAEGEEKTCPVWTFEFRVPLLWDYATHREENVSKYYTYYSKDKLPGEEKVQEMMRTFYSAWNKVEAERASLEKMAKDIPSANLYSLQYLVQAVRGPLGRYTSQLRLLYGAYQRLSAALIWMEAYTGEEKDAIGKNKFYIENFGTKTISEFAADIDGKFERIMSDNAVSKAGGVALFNAYSASVQATGITNTSAVHTLAEQIGTEAEGYVKTIEAGKDYLLSASAELQKAKELIQGELATAESNWKIAATDPEIKDTALAKQDSAEIEELGRYLNGGDIQKLITRLNNISSDLDTTAKQLRNYQYQGKFIGDIKGYEDVKSALEDKIGSSNLKSVPLTEGAINTQATQWFNWQSGGMNISWAKKQDHAPNLAVDKLRFYSYLYTHFSGALSAAGGPDQSAKAEQEKKVDNLDGKDLLGNIKSVGSSASSNTALEASGGSEKYSYKKNNNITGKELPSADFDKSGAPSGSIPPSDEDTSLSKTSSSLDSMFKVIGEGLNAFGTDLRDKLFVSDYVLSMFSYNTIVQEKCKKENIDADKAVPTTLTQVAMSKDNNYAYGYEVEYAIYGGSNSSNVTKAYGSIYAIRLGFNLVYAFTDGEIRETALGIAVPISAATLGIVPVPLIQAAVIVAVACCESALDLGDLRNGEAVPLFKNSSTWRCSASGLLQAAKNEIKEAVGEEIKTYVGGAINYADEELAKMLDATDEELENMLQGGSEKLKENLEASYDAMITRHAETAIQQLTTLADQAIEEHAIDPAINMADYVSQGMDRWLAHERSNSSSDDLALAAKEQAVTIIKSQYIDSVLSVVIEGKGIQGGIEDYSQKLMKEINRIRGEISNKIENGSTEISRYKSEMINRLEDAATEGTDALRNELNNQIDGIFGTGSGGANTDNTGVASLISFRYSDYLRLFLMIGLYTNEAGVVLRTADLIQKNMNLTPRYKSEGGEATAFLMKNAAVYLDLNATVQVKPTLLALPLLAPVEGNPAGDAGWYTVEIQDVRGY